MGSKEDKNYNFNFKYLKKYCEEEGIYCSENELSRYSQEITLGTNSFTKIKRHFTNKGNSTDIETRDKIEINDTTKLSKLLEYLETLELKSSRSKILISTLMEKINCFINDECTQEKQ